MHGWPRRTRMQEEAAKASPKIQLVVALMLVPSVLLLVAAALAAPRLIGDGGGGAALMTGAPLSRAAPRSSANPARQQETIRWKERSTVALPSLLRVTTRTPFTLAAAEVTEIWPVPGAEADSSPSVAK